MKGFTGWALPLWLAAGVGLGGTMAACGKTQQQAIAPPGLGWEELGEAYDRGDYATVLAGLTPRAEQGEALAQYRLSVMYFEGEGVPKDYTESAKWCRKAADQGHAWAQHNFGVMHRLGKGVPRNQIEAAKWFRKAADQGNPLSQIAMAQMLIEAAREDQADVLADLVAAGAMVDARDQDQGTALLAAAEAGHIASVEILLASGAEVDASGGTMKGGTFEHTALGEASAYGHEAVVQLLLASGADVEARSQLDSTSLYRAAEGGHAGVVAILLASGAEVDAQSSNRWTPLMAAAELSPSSARRRCRTARQDRSHQAVAGRWSRSQPSRRQLDGADESCQAAVPHSGGRGAVSGGRRSRCGD